MSAERIQIKTGREIEAMRKAGKLTAAARALAGAMVKPGTSTRAIDRAVREFIVQNGGRPSFLHYCGYPASVCVSINDTVIHGIPGGRIIKEGDIVSIDVGAYIDGFHGDCAATYAAGECSPEALRLVQVTRESFFEGLKFAREGCFVSDISRAVQEHAEKAGYSLVRDFVGHGIGSAMHEPPEVPNFVSELHGRGRLLKAGMTLAIEPMVNEGMPEVRILSDDWTVVTVDGSLSAHYENTVLITDGAPEILTPVEGDGFI